LTATKNTLEAQKEVLIQKEVSQKNQLSELDKTIGDMREAMRKCVPQ
jgi:hypothetical protein